MCIGTSIGTDTGIGERRLNSGWVSDINLRNHDLGKGKDPYNLLSYGLNSLCFLVFDWTPYKKFEYY